MNVGETFQQEREREREREPAHKIILDQTFGRPKMREKYWKINLDSPIFSII